MRRPSFQFYPADWRKDAALQSCSVAAQGLWINIMCIAHECEPYGFMVINGNPMTTAQIGRLVGLSAKECQVLVTELSNAGVLSINDDGAIFSRRMVKDEELRNVRANGGKAGSEHGIKGAEYGKMGGRPRKLTGDKKPPLHDEEDAPLNPPPSSSSSSSSSKTNNPLTPLPGGEGQTPDGEPENPKAERKARIQLRTFINHCIESDEKPISGYAPLLAYIDDTGLPMDFVQLAWDVFKREFLEPGPNHKRLQADWRRHFLNYVQKGYYGLWYAKTADNSGAIAYTLSTRGLQEQAVSSKREAA